MPYIDMNQPWIYMYSPSRSPLPPPSLPDPSGSSQCTRSEHLSHTSHLGWWSVSPLIVYLFQCCPLETSHPRLLPQSPKVCSVHLCLFFCFAYRVIVTVFLNSIWWAYFSPSCCDFILISDDWSWTQGYPNPHLEWLCPGDSWFSDMRKSWSDGKEDMIFTCRAGRESLSPFSSPPPPLSLSLSPSLPLHFSSTQTGHDWRQSLAQRQLDHEENQPLCIQLRGCLKTGREELYPPWHHGMSRFSNCGFLILPGMHFLTMWTSLGWIVHPSSQKPWNDPV